MGNLCGKESADPFAQPGRTLSSGQQPIQNKTSAVPRAVGEPPRTLGSSASPKNNSTTARDDARRKAAEAAEARAGAASKTKGRLGTQLQGQKKQTRTDTLNAASNEERRLRDVDTAAESRAYN